MPRLFFHFINRTGRLVDEEGQELPICEAKRRAVEEIRSVLAEETKSGELDLRGRIEVESETGQTILVVPFSEAVTVIGAEE